MHCTCPLLTQSGHSVGTPRAGRSERKHSSTRSGAPRIVKEAVDPPDAISESWDAERRRRLHAFAPKRTCLRTNALYAAMCAALGSLVVPKTPGRADRKDVLDVRQLDIRRYSTAR
jgi:hypothetical protein